MDVAERNDLVVANLGLVRRVAFKMRAALDRGGLPMDDALQIGAIALIRAVENYRPEISKLSTYATTCIRMQLLSALRDNHLIRAPKYIHETNIQKPRMAEKLAAAALAENVGTLNAEPLDDSVREQAEEENREEVRVALTRVRPRRREVLIQHYLAGRTLADIGRETSLTRARVEQINANGLADMKIELHARRRRESW